MSNEMTKTDYELNQCDERFSIWKKSKCVSKGFTDKESALHSVWVIEGKVSDDFYVADKDGRISKVDRGCL